MRQLEIKQEIHRLLNATNKLQEALTEKDGVSFLLMIDDNGDSEGVLVGSVKSLTDLLYAFSKESMEVEYAILTAASRICDSEIKKDSGERAKPIPHSCPKTAKNDRCRI